QCVGNPDRGGRAVPRIRDAAQSDDRQRRDEPELGLGGHQRAASAPRRAVVSLPGACLMPTEVSPDSNLRLASVPAAIRHVHLIGVAGTAMAALAGMLAERGFRVTGSDDQLYEPAASLLK